MTPEENRRRLTTLRFEEHPRDENTRKSVPQPIHNSAEALWIKRMNSDGQGSRMPRRSRGGRIA